VPEADDRDDPGLLHGRRSRRGAVLRFALCRGNSRFAIPAARLGLGYAYGGIKRLVDVVGPSFAKEIFYTARQFSADEAVSMGLINRTYSAADLLGAVNDADPACPTPR
jgi:enoyl-CoA hydratase/carnithine racemase